MNLFIFIFIAATFAIYFAPTMVAWNKHQAPGVFAVNFLFGWSVVGWAVAMGWALAPDEHRRSIDQRHAVG
jgi:hypothetical protein